MFAVNTPIGPLPESSSLVIAAETNGHLYVNEPRNGDSMSLWTQPRHSQGELDWVVDAEMIADKPRDAAVSSRGS